MDTFRRLSRQSYAAGLGALYAYESQFPGVATAKIEGLMDRYGISDEATLRFFDWTVSETYGVWPFFEMLPETACVEMPPRISPGFVLQAEATCASVDSAVAITFTVLGFVCALCSWTLPLAVYGWPR